MKDRGFLASLFDLSFNEFITTRLIKVIFVLGIVIAGLLSFSMFVGGASQGFFPFLMMLIVAPLLFLVYVVVLRVWLELVIVIFRIAENIQRIADGKVGHDEQPPPPPVQSVE